MLDSCDAVKSFEGVTVNTPVVL